MTDLEAHIGGTILETVRVGKTPGDRSGEVDLFEPEPQPRLIHRIIRRRRSRTTRSPSRRWAACRSTGPSCSRSTATASRSGPAGGGATSGPAVPQGGIHPRPPLAAFLDGTRWREVAFPAAPFTTTDRFVDVAAVPGTTTAWAAVERFGEGADRRLRARRAAGTRRHCDGDHAPGGGPGRGSAAKVAFTGPNEGWMVTASGLAVPLHRRHRVSAQHRPGVRRHDHLPAQRGGRAVHPRHAAGRRLRAVQAAARRARAGAAARRDPAAAGAAAAGPHEAARPHADRDVQAHAPRAGAAARAAQGPHGRAHESRAR